MLCYCRLLARLPVMALSRRVIDTARGGEETQRDSETGVGVHLKRLALFHCIPYLTTTGRVSIRRERCLESFLDTNSTLPRRRALDALLAALQLSCCPMRA
jgi:hypothetical protein